EAGPLKKKVMGIVTDPTPVEAPKDPDTSTIFALYKLFATAEERAEMEQRFRAGGYGYGDAKKALLEKVEGKFGPLREKRRDWLARSDDLEDVLAQGAQRARAVAAPLMERIRDAVGLRQTPRFK
ncbi:MAG TPA: tryptophan--tRNA ligase, partial [bacterium]|nr:tryptophan--tRNA ligase [bacterium]